MSGGRVKVVAISGHPGSGKTTLTRALAVHFNVPAVCYDDYEKITALPPAAVEKWVAEGSDYNAIDLAPMLDAIAEAARAGPRFVLLDTLLGRAHRASGAAIWLSLWLDVPADVALARKLGAAAGRVGENFERATEFARWIAGYSRHYEGFIAATYATQRERVRSRADVVLGQWRDVDAVRGEAIAAIEERGL